MVSSKRGVKGNAPSNVSLAGIMVIFLLCLEVYAFVDLVSTSLQAVTRFKRTKVGTIMLGARTIGKSNSFSAVGSDVKI